MLYVPDYLANAGGVITIAHEHGGYDRAAAERHIAGIHDTVLRVHELAEQDGITTAEAADHYAEERIEAARPKPLPLRP